MNDSLATAIADFLAHKRALGRKYQTEEATLRLPLAFADQLGLGDPLRLFLLPRSCRNLNALAPPGTNMEGGDVRVAQAPATRWVQGLGGGWGTPGRYVKGRR